MSMANLKIKAAMIFDTKDYLLDDDADKVKTFKPVIEKNNKLISSLRKNAFSERVYVYFRLKRGGKSPTTFWLDVKNNVCYVPVNTGTFFKTGQIPTKWVQDIFVQTSALEIYYQPDRMNPGLLNALSGTITNDFGVKFNVGNKCQIDGGNVQEIEINQQRFIVTGKLKNLQNCPDPAGHLPLPYQLLPVKNVWHKNMNEFERPTHHLDMFFMWVGSANKLSNCIIRSEVYFARWVRNVFKQVRINKAIKDGIKDGLKLKELNFIDLPAMLFDDPNQTGKGFYAMTFANSIVENYSDGGAKKVNVYLPDFTDTLAHLLMQESVPAHLHLTLKSKKSDRAELFNDFPFNLQLLFYLIITFIQAGPNDEELYSDKDLSNLWLTLFYKDRSEYARKFIDKMNKRVLERINSADKSIYVHFIQNNFANYAEHYGGLHCLVKPIYG